MHTTDTDIDFYQRELSSFIPDRIFDAHCHLWHQTHADIQVDGVPASAGYELVGAPQRQPGPGHLLEQRRGAVWSEMKTPWA